MTIVLVALLTLLPVAAFAAAPKSSQRSQKSAISARQTTNNSFGSKPVQASGSVVRGGRTISGH